MTGTDTGTTWPSENGYGPSMMRVVFVVAAVCVCHCAAAATLAARVGMGADHPGVVLAAVLFNVRFVPHKLLDRLLLVVLLGCRSEPLVS